MLMSLDFQALVLRLKLKNVFLVMLYEDEVRTVGGVCISVIMLDTFNGIAISRIEE
jgi:hypothetical protein